MFEEVIKMSALGALITLDDNVFLRIMLAQPIACGSLIGLFAGDIRLGAAIGAFFQLLWVFDVPAGGFVSIDYASCTSVTTILMVVARWQGIAFQNAAVVCLPIFALLGIGSGMASTSLTKSLRRFNQVFVDRAEAGLEKGNTNAVWSSNLLALLPMFAKSFLVIFVPVLFGTLVIVPLGKRLCASLSVTCSVPWLTVAFLGVGIGIGLRALVERSGLLLSLLSAGLVVFLIKGTGLRGPVALVWTLVGCVLITLVWLKLRPNER